MRKGGAALRVEVSVIVARSWHWRLSPSNGRRKRSERWCITLWLEYVDGGCRYRSRAAAWCGAVGGGGGGIPQGFVPVKQRAIAMQVEMFFSTFLFIFLGS